jgi:hypothetical protein
VAGLAEKADYLPRTWAKLEIDRLVADGAEKNKARIVDLSKAMYVMSPFTSLLVLENEEMYAQYHVDRGRKDHWAMYACPEKIPVVNEPLVGPANPSSKTEEKGPTAEEVLSTVMVRVPPAILGRAGGRPSGIWTVPIVDWAASLWDSDLGNGGRAAQEIGPANVVEEQWQKDVQNTINEARKQVNVDPAAAESTIRHKQQDLAAVSEMRPEMRDCMTNMLSAALREIKHRGEEFIFRQQAIQREAAAQTEVELPASALPMDGYKLAQL